MDISGFSSISWSSAIMNKNQNRQNLPGNVAPATANAATSLSAAPKATDDAMQEFKDYMNQTPAERLQYQWLAQHGITKEQFDALPPEEKQKLLAQMKQELEQKIKQNVEKSVTTNILV